MKQLVVATGIVFVSAICDGMLLCGSPGTAAAQQSQSPSTQATPDIWLNGFLERTYRQEVELSLICSKCLPLAVIVEEHAKVTRLGVGDRDGLFNAGGGMTYKGAGTIDGLNLPIGGAIVHVRIGKKGDRTSVGIKVGDGDRKLSEAVHRALAKALAAKRSAK